MVTGSRSSGQWAWLVAAVLAFGVGVAILLAAASLRDDLGRRAEAQVIIHEAQARLLEGDPESAGRALRRLRGHLAGTASTLERETALRRAAGAAAALASDPDARADAAVEAVQEVDALVVSEAQALYELLTWLAVGGALGTAALALALGGWALRGRLGESRSPDDALGVERLSALVEASERREARRERFLANLDAVLLDLDRDGRVDRASSEAHALFTRPSTQILGARASDLIVLSTETGEALEDWRRAASTPHAHVLEQPRGTGQLVTVEYADDGRDGASVLLRRAGPAHARLRALREMDQARVAALSDPKLLAMLVGPDDRVREATRGARETWRIPPGLPSIEESWSERAGLTAVVARSRTDATAKPLDDRVTLRDGDGRPFDADVRVVPARGAGTWIRVLRVEGDRARGRSGAGRPEAGAGRPDVGAGRPEAGAGRPEAGAGRPEVGAGRPALGAGRPAVGAGRSEVGAGRPEAGAGRPDVGAGRSEAGAERPHVGAGRREGAAAEVASRSSEEAWLGPAPASGARASPASAVGAGERPPRVSVEPVEPGAARSGPLDPSAEKAEGPRPVEADADGGPEDRRQTRSAPPTPRSVEADADGGSEARGRAYAEAAHLLPDGRAEPGPQAVTVLAPEVRDRPDPGGGSEARERAEPGPPKTPAEPGPVTPTTARVLVIDDEAAIGRSLARALRGSVVEIAGGGREGLDRLLGPEIWDLVLCDIGMPEVDGVRVHEELSALKPEVLERVVFMTGALHTDRARRFVEEVAPPLIEKPFDLAEVRAVLAARCRSATADRVP